MLNRFHAVCSFLPLLGFGGPDDNPADEADAAADSGETNANANAADADADSTLDANANGQPPADHESMPEEAFREELVTHIDSMFRLGLTLTRNPRDAEDLAQEALTRALAKYKQFRPDTNMRAWLLAIVRNAFINRYRRERKAPSTVDFDGVEAFVADPTPDNDAHGLSVRQVQDLARIEEQLDGELRKALYELSDEFRETFLLAVVEELSYKDIAAILDVPVGTVMSRLFRARRQMASRLQNYGKRSGWLDENETGGAGEAGEAGVAGGAPDAAADTGEPAT
ncbi:MAG: sigma-70 family RNA polymerase sigma factor [Planctomycetota bacterium]